MWLLVMYMATFRLHTASLPSATHTIKETIHITRHPTTLTGIVENKFQKYGCPQGGTPKKIGQGGCGPLPKTLTLFMTKICDFPYPIYDLTKTLIPYL